MRILVVSDLHGNMEMIRELERMIGRYKFSINEIWCLGDFMGYAAPESQREALRWVREHCKVVLRGNHEQAILERGAYFRLGEHARPAIDHLSGRLSQDELSFLSGLPTSHWRNRLMAVHAAPHDHIWGNINKTGQEVFSAMPPGVQLCLHGHIHVPQVVTEGTIASQRIPLELYPTRGSAPGSACPQLGPQPPRRSTIPVETARVLLEKERRQILCVGSIGQPRDGSGMMSALVIDESGSNLLADLLFAPCDTRGTIKAIDDSGLPPEAIEELRANW